MSDIIGLRHELDIVQKQIATTRRFDEPAGAPVAHAQAAATERRLAAMAAERRAGETSLGRLELAEAALASAGELLVRARELGIEGLTGARNSVDRAAIATELEEISAALLALANRRDAAGRALFSGLAGDDDAFAGRPEAARWAGLVTTAFATDPRAVPVGRTIFGDQPSAMAAVAELAAQLRFGLPDPGAGEAALAAVGAAFDRVLDGRTLVGTRMARVGADLELLRADELALRVRLSGLVDTDLVEAAARLQQLQTVLRAAQESYARINEGSLFDVLR